MEVITRLRPKWSDEKLAEFYGKPYSSNEWPEHNRRVEWTISRLKLFLDAHPEITKIVDLSCGDGRILHAMPVAHKVYGDIAPAPHITVVGDIAKTVCTTSGDLLICSETLEHLDDPGEFLYQAERRFRWICITTPLGETDPEKNYEHYWGWDLWGISEMLHANDWFPHRVDTLNEAYYTYQLWIARSSWV